MCRYRTDGIFERLFDAIATSHRRPVSLRRHPDLFALFLNVPTAEVNKHLRTDGALLASGAVVVDYEGRCIPHARAAAGRALRAQRTGNNKSP